jgi:hypothetical protein
MRVTASKRVPDAFVTERVAGAIRDWWEREEQH